jgi:hypothetical protein
MFDIGVPENDAEFVPTTTRGDRGGTEPEWRGDEPRASSTRSREVSASACSEGKRPRHGRAAALSQSGDRRHGYDSDERGSPLVADVARTPAFDTVTEGEAQAPDQGDRVGALRSWVGAAGLEHTNSAV